MIRFIGTILEKQIRKDLSNPVIIWVSGDTLIVIYAGTFVPAGCSAAALLDLIEYGIGASLALRVE